MSYDLPRLLHNLSRFSPVLKSLISLPLRYDMLTVSYNTSHTSKSFLFLFGLLRYITVTINTEKHINTANARSAQLKYHSLVTDLPAAKAKATIDQYNTESIIARFFFKAFSSKSPYSIILFKARLKVT